MQGRPNNNPPWQFLRMAHVVRLRKTLSPHSVSSFALDFVPDPRNPTGLSRHALPSTCDHFVIDPLGLCGIEGCRRPLWGVVEVTDFCFSSVFPSKGVHAFILTRSDLFGRATYGIDAPHAAVSAHLLAPFRGRRCGQVHRV